MIDRTQIPWFQKLAVRYSASKRPLRHAVVALAPLIAVLAGCGAGPVKARTTSNPALSIAPGSGVIDTNCTGCNGKSAHGNPVHKFTAAVSAGDSDAVTWSVSGGDPAAGPGTINCGGTIYASQLPHAATGSKWWSRRRSSPIRMCRLSLVLTLTPGFLQPLTPENVALGPGGSVTVTGYLAEAGGANEIHFALSNTPSGGKRRRRVAGPGQLPAKPSGIHVVLGHLHRPPHCLITGVTYVVATVPGSSARTEAAILLNSPGVASNPATHQNALAFPMLLGSSAEITTTSMRRATPSSTAAAEPLARW